MKKFVTEALKFFDGGPKTTQRIQTGLLTGQQREVSRYCPPVLAARLVLAL